MPKLLWKDRKHLKRIRCRFEEYLQGVGWEPAFLRYNDLKRVIHLIRLLFSKHKQCPAQILFQSTGEEDSDSSGKVSDFKKDKLLLIVYDLLDTFIDELSSKSTDSDHSLIVNSEDDQRELLIKTLSGVVEIEVEKIDNFAKINASEITRFNSPERLEQK